ncbi:thymidylate kinase [compost metagenome]
MNPDCAVMLTLDDINTSKERIKERGVQEKPDTFESRDLEFQQRVLQGYSDIAKTYNLPTISAVQSIEEVAEDIKKLLI